MCTGVPSSAPFRRQVPGIGHFARLGGFCGHDASSRMSRQSGQVTSWPSRAISPMSAIASQGRRNHVIAAAKIGHPVNHPLGFSHCDHRFLSVFPGHLAGLVGGGESNPAVTIRPVSTHDFVLYREFVFPQPGDSTSPRRLVPRVMRWHSRGFPPAHPLDFG